MRSMRSMSGGGDGTRVSSPLPASSASDGVTAAAGPDADAASVESAAAAAADVPRGKTAVVVGAGPAGALTAVYLADQGWHVRVFEARPAHAPSDTAAQSPRRPPDRSYNIVLSARGLGALEGAGVTLPEDGIVRLEGNVRHLNGVGSFSGQFKGTVAVNRGTLADAIVAAAVAKHATPSGVDHGGREGEGGGGGTRRGHALGGCGSVEFLYGRVVHGVDFESRVAQFIKTPPPPPPPRLESASEEKAERGGGDDEEAIESASYNLLVAADGVNSAVRGMLRDDGAVGVEQNTDEMLFKTVRLPAQTPSSQKKKKSHEKKTAETATEAEARAKAIEAEATTWRRCFHTWPSGLVSMLAPPDPRGTLSAVIILPGGSHAPARAEAAAGAGAGEKTIKTKKTTPAWTWDRVKTKEDVAALFRDCFPDAFGTGTGDGTNGTGGGGRASSSFSPPSDEECERVLAQTARPGGVTTTCSRLTAHGGSVALVGDAAHSMAGANVWAVACLYRACTLLGDLVCVLRVFVKCG